MLKTVGTKGKQPNPIHGAEDAKPCQNPPRVTATNRSNTARTNPYEQKDRA
jgi:hypothetical protein